MNQNSLLNIRLLTAIAGFSARPHHPPDPFQQRAEQTQPLHAQSLHAARHGGQVRALRLPHHLQDPTSRTLLRETAAHSPSRGAVIREEGCLCVHSRPAELRCESECDSAQLSWLQPAAGGQPRHDYGSVQLPRG